MVAGISGFSGYFPENKVNLSELAAWTQADPSKFTHVIGDSFRMCGPHEDCYTMAASAVCSLIRSYQIDPADVGFFALATESSTDNSAGTILVKGLVNEELGSSIGEIARDCEIPEFKHACLAGVYAIKAAVRYLLTDGKNRRAIVVCSDQALYERGSSGEPTQGSGAIAMVLDAQAGLLEVSLTKSASVSSYRDGDFRKPLFRDPAEIHFPVFNGKLSTACYIDSVLAAGRLFFSSSVGEAIDTLGGFRQVFLHRPYEKMAETGALYLHLLAVALSDPEALDAMCNDIGSDVSRVRQELLGHHNSLEPDFRHSQALARHIRASDDHEFSFNQLGRNTVRQLGNLYTASLPAWMASAFEELRQEENDITGEQWLSVGYGSGDAAEIVPIRVVPGWREYADKIGIRSALEGPKVLSLHEYQRLHASSHLVSRWS